MFLSQNKPPEPSGGFFFNDNTVYVCTELRCPTGAPIPISPPRKPTSVPSLLADARSQLSLRCSTHNAQNSAAGEGRISQREERCTLPETDGFGETRPLHIDPATKRPIASRAAAITSINVTRVLRCIVCASYSGEEQPGGTSDPYEVASLYCRLGETNQALEWLQKAYQERSPRMEELKEEPAFDNLRSDPRFGDFLRRVGLLQR